MKKYLISGISVLMASSALAAEAPKVRIEGRMDVQAGVVNQKSEFQNSIPSDPASGQKMSTGGVVNDTKLDIHVDGKVSKDFTYGGMIRLHADTSVATNKEGAVADKTMVYIQHEKIGRLEAGNMPGAGGLFEMDTVNLAKGSWGVEGFTSQWITDRTKRTTEIFSRNTGIGTIAALVGGFKDTRSIEMIISPNLPTNYSGHYYSDAPKVNFFTKPLKELTLGVAFIPDMDSAGTIRGQASRTGGPVDSERSSNPATFKNIISGGFVYENKFYKDFGIKTGLTGELGKAKLSYVNDLRAYEAGMMLSYKELKIGATVGSWFDSLTLKQKTTGGRHGSNYFTLGASHQIDKLGYSLTYLNSRKAGGIEILGKQITDVFAPLVSAQDFADTRYNKFNNVVLDVDYKLAPGMLPYASFSSFRFKESTGAKDSGYVALIGTRLLF